MFMDSVGQKRGLGMWWKLLLLLVAMATCGALACQQGQCSHDSQCDGGKQVCVGGECQSCELYGCPSGKTCVEGSCLPYQCTADSDCQRDQVCDNQRCIVPDGGVPEIPVNTPDPQRCPSQGKLCQSDADCNGGTCTSPIFLPRSICTQRCQSDADCCSGFKCHDDPVNERGFCLPECTNDASCQTPYPHMPRCTAEKHCWSYGETGGTCRNTDECSQGLNCQSPGGIGFFICTKECQKTSDCDQGAICEQPVRDIFVCLPTCKTDRDCAGYPALNFCHKHGYCWRKAPSE